LIRRFCLIHSVSSSSHHYKFPLFYFLIHKSYLVEGFSVVDAYDASNHLWHNDHVTQVSLNNCRLFKRWRLFLGFSKLLDESHRFAFQTTSETSTDTAVHELRQLFIGHVEKLIKIDSAVREFTEGTLLAHLFFRSNLKLRRMIK
jgi:hypothetical protein